MNTGLGQPVRPSSPLTEALMQLDKQIVSLLQTVSTLSQRLEPVMELDRPAITSQNNKEAKPPVNYSSSIVGIVNDKVERLASLDLEINSLMNRLEV